MVHLLLLHFICWCFIYCNAIALYGIRGWCGTRRISARYVTVTARRTASQCRNPPPCFLPGCFYFCNIYMSGINIKLCQEMWIWNISISFRTSLISHFHPIFLTRVLYAIFYISFYTCQIKHQPMNSDWWIPIGLALVSCVVCPSVPSDTTNSDTTNSARPTLRDQTWHQRHRRTERICISPLPESLICQL